DDEPEDDELPEMVDGGPTLSSLREALAAAEEEERTAKGALEAGRQRVVASEEAATRLVELERIAAERAGAVDAAKAAVTAAESAAGAARQAAAEATEKARAQAEADEQAAKAKAEAGAEAEAKARAA